MSLALMKMAVLGIERVGKTLVKMDTDVDGQGWVVKAMMVPRNGKKWYIIILSYNILNVLSIVDLGLKQIESNSL